LSDFRNDLLPELESIYHRMIEKDKDDRFASATELRQALEGLVHADAETSIRFATAETEQTERRARNIEDAASNQPVLNWAVLLVSLVTSLLILFAFHQTRHNSNSTDMTTLDLTANAQSTSPETDSARVDHFSSELGFALEFNGRSQVVLPAYVFEDDHVLIVELDLTPLLSDRSTTRSVFSHEDSQFGWNLQIQNNFWNLCLGEREFPLVQLNSAQPVRWGTLSHLTIVVHAGYAGLYLDGQLQAEWEGVGEFLPAAGKMTVGYANSASGFVGKIQHIELSRVDQLLVDHRGKRLLPQKRRTVAEYRFDQGGGSLLGDSSRAERHGTIEGAVWSFSD
jgi:hypothetical protein